MMDPLCGFTAVTKKTCKKKKRETFKLNFGVCDRTRSSVAYDQAL